MHYISLCSLTVMKSIGIYIIKVHLQSRLVNNINHTYFARYNFLKFNSDQDDICSPNFVFEPVAPVKIDY